MKKKYLYYLIIFIITFVISFIFLFPYTTFSRYLVNKYIVSKYKNFISYQNIKSNIIKTEITDVQLYINKKIYTVKSITIDHDPIFLLKKEILISLNPIRLTLNIKKTNNKILYQGKVNLYSLRNYIEGQSIKGNIIIKGYFNNSKGIGIIHAYGDKLIFKNNFLNLKLNHIVASILINRNRITIKNLTAQGTPKLDITGNVILNSRYISMSPINVKVKIILPKFTKYITISGCLFNPRVIY